MEENQIAFYHSKGKLFLGSLLSFIFIPFGVLVLYAAYTEESVFIIALGLFLTILFSTFFLAGILKMIRGYPYIIVTEAYIQLDPYTKSEAKLYYTDISYIKVSEVSFQKLTEIVLYDEDDYYARLSLHNKVRLFMNRVFHFSLFTINAKAVRKRERPELLKTLKVIAEEKIEQRSSTSIVEAARHQEVETDFLETYDPTPPVDRSIDKSYFLKAYGYGLFIFAIAFIFFYLLISKNNDYLFYIIISFILYPFAKVLIDWLFGFKLRHAIDKQKGATYYFQQLIFVLDFILFHVSLLVSPFGFLLLLICYIVNKIRYRDS